MKAIEADLPSLADLSCLDQQLPWDGTRVDLPRISGLALADPETSFTQDEVLGLLGLSDDEFAQRIFSRCGVRRRRLTLTDEFLATTVQGRTLAIEEQLFGDAVRAIDELGVDPADIGVVVSATLYSLGGPTIAHRLVDHYGMDPSTDKYHVVGVGCASAVPLMRLASQTLREHPGKKGLVVAAESMTGILMGANADDPRSKTVGSSIFGDGCAAAVIEYGDPLPAAPEGPRTGPTILASKVHQISGTLGAVRMQLAADDSFLHLIRELPDVAGTGLRELVDEFLAGQGLTRNGIDHWLVHPGGRRIIESVQEALSLTREDVEVSYEVLAEHGNVGTPSIFYVMKHAIERRQPQAGELGLMVTVGPGVTVGLMLLQW
ncbi:MAG TPA: 3-oxoacyl-[acyl-carrier-protein] synthase III C-terminal domain-containing protein [Solirubrobacteraceae bacterium]|nr:3-oxoacyl-[acyl-carrier-protein] synthase III C-terminal domain-containing protein [Solirubrobacteraceae bacterium]